RAVRRPAREARRPRILRLGTLAPRRPSADPANPRCAPRRCGYPRKRKEGMMMAALMKRPSAVARMRRSAGGTRNLAVLAIAFSFALLSGHVALTLVALWLYGMCVVRDVASPRFGKRLAAEDAEKRRRLPESVELNDPGLRMTVSSIRAGYAEIARVLKRTPPPIHAHVGAAL